jgi:hypothetical protein
MWRPALPLPVMVQPRVALENHRRQPFLIAHFFRVTIRAFFMPRGSPIQG